MLYRNKALSLDLKNTDYNFLTKDNKTDRSDGSYFTSP